MVAKSIKKILLKMGYTESDNEVLQSEESSIEEQKEPLIYTQSNHLQRWVSRICFFIAAILMVIFIKLNFIRSKTFLEEIDHNIKMSLLSFFILIFIIVGFIYHD